MTKQIQKQQDKTEKRKQALRALGWTCFTVFMSAAVFFGFIGIAALFNKTTYSVEFLNMAAALTKIFS